MASSEPPPGYSSPSSAPPGFSVASIATTDESQNGGKIREEAERVFRHLAVDFITRHNPEFDISKSYEFKASERDPLELQHQIEFPLRFPSYLQPIFCPETGHITDYEERWEPDTEQDCSARNSMSIRRAPDSSSFGQLLGDSNNVPFLPAGFDDAVESILRFSNRVEPDGTAETAEERRYMDFEDILNMLPGHSAPIDLNSLHLNDWNDGTKREELEGLSVLQKLPEDFDLAMSEVTGETTSAATKRGKTLVSIQEKPSLETSEVMMSLSEEDAHKLEEAMSTASDSNRTADVASSTSKPKRRSDSDFPYAQVLDVSKKVGRFESMRDTMARKFSFELDPFQQQAVVCMEEGSSVFVAAHTSAGKTVVAEYAVALCKLHRTRAIYTSPIKALSNQKFRDFKILFDDVGLVTGDIQLNPEAFCLIMTTEILRSMLYNGSEVVRELEWVIFDEVHYINDAERGHVWEEVLIMLPAHVKIVMLSATVPNCVEFADWVGRIKNRKIFVIQTLKRPVPLEHNLYTGQDGKTKKDMFLILDKQGNFLHSGYQKAVEAKAKKMEKLQTAAAGRGRGGAAAQQGRGGRGGGGGQNARGGGPTAGRGRGGGPPPYLGGQQHKQMGNNAKNVYINLVDHLRTLDLLPMVVFVFSRQRCDDNAQMLHSVDLTTESEKSAIHRFFIKCIERLKGSDKQLPQVLLMQELCKRGFAVHHSGILPIVKEVVELLFQRGFVKILFATETFAMGVNMPARTVVFDTIEKFDGNQRRILNATEYVQMAGRAGRRGLDSTGTVIILAKGPEPPDIASLKSMLQGKPIRLESRFRITYGMLLNLLRVEQLRIEDMLQRSYVERVSLRMVVSRKEKLKMIDEEIEALPTVECSHCYPEAADPKDPCSRSSPSLLSYFNTFSTYFDELAQIWPILVHRGREDKLFSVGRVLVINYAPLGMVGRLGVVLKSNFNETGSGFLLTLFVQNTTQTSNEVADLNAFAALTTEEQRWKRLTLLLEHAVMNGPEGVEPAQQSISRNSPFTVIEDVGLECLVAVCKRSISKLDVNAILEEHRRQQGLGRAKSPDRSVRKLLSELDTLGEKFFRAQLERSDPSELIYVLGKDIDHRDLDLFDRLRKLRELRERLVDPEAFPCTQCSHISLHLQQLIRRNQLEEDKTRLIFETSSENLQFSKEYTDRLKVLQTLNYIDKQNMVGLKGKVACEISNQELLITELILENKFERCPAEIAAILSTITCQFEAKSSGAGKFTRENGLYNGYIGNEEAPPEPKRMSKELLRELQEDILQIAFRIDAIQKTYGVVSSPVVDELKFGLMEAVYQWASGMEFAQIMRLSEAQEGIIVRCIQRLDEVCKDVRKAARIVGDPALFEKMEETSAAIRRDIVFAASLYTTE